MAKLTGDQQQFIVDELACFARPATICAQMLERYGVRIDSKQVVKYDPTTMSGGRQLSHKLTERFYRTRDLFERELLPVAIANRAYRVREIGFLYQLAVDEKRWADARALLELAAKEVGNAFTNVQQLKHSGAVTTVTIDTTAEQAKNLLVDRLILQLEDKRKDRKEAA